MRCSKSGSQREVQSDTGFPQKQQQQQQQQKKTNQEKSQLNNITYHLK